MGILLLKKAYAELLMYQSDSCGGAPKKRMIDFDSGERMGKSKGTTPGGRDHAEAQLSCHFATTAPTLRNYGFHASPQLPRRFAINAPTLRNHGLHASPQLPPRFGIAAQMLKR